VLKMLPAEEPWVKLGTSAPSAYNPEFLKLVLRKSLL